MEKAIELIGEEHAQNARILVGPSTIAPFLLPLVKSSLTLPRPRTPDSPHRVRQGRKRRSLRIRRSLAAQEMDCTR